MPVTVGMKGEGYYDDNSSPQWASIAAVLPWLQDALGMIELATSGGPIVVADFACSEGRNSVRAAAQIIAGLRARTQRPIQAVFSDLPTNNFNKLFANLYPQGQPLFSDVDAFPSAVAGSMFDQLLPAASVAVATTYNAIGFLDRRPDVAIPDYILPMGPARPRPGVDVGAEARRAYAVQARDDLVRFYSARAAELIPGGKLLVATFGAGERIRACDGLYDVLNDALLDLVASGRLSRGSYEGLVFPIYFRTAEELVEPIVGASARLPGLFRLDRIETMEVADPFNERLERTGDVRAYAQDFTSFMRAFTEPIIRMAFAAEPDIEAVIAGVYSGVEARLATDPASYSFHYIQVAALLTKHA